MNGRENEAIDFLIRCHGNKDPQNVIVRLEVEEFRENISLNGSDKRWWDYRYARSSQISFREHGQLIVVRMVSSALVKTKNARWRSFMVFLMGLFGQMSGNGLGTLSVVLLTLSQPDNLVPITGYFNLQIYESIGFNCKLCVHLSSLVVLIGLPSHDAIRNELDRCYHCGTVFVGGRVTFRSYASTTRCVNSVERAAARLSAIRMTDLDRFSIGMGHSCVCRPPRLQRRALRQMGIL